MSYTPITEKVPGSHPELPSFINWNNVLGGMGIVAGIGLIEMNNILPDLKDSYFHLLTQLPNISNIFQAYKGFVDNPELINQAFTQLEWRALISGSIFLILKLAGSIIRGRSSDGYMSGAPWEINIRNKDVADGLNFAITILGTAVGLLPVMMK